MKIPLDAHLEGTLIKRYKRFLADVELKDGSQITVHCPNPGAMLGCSTPGSQVRCSTSDNPKRKLPNTLEMIRVGRSWVGLQPLHANRIAKVALTAGAIAPLAGYASVKPEVKVHGGSRLDFLLEDALPNCSDQSGRAAYVEVKSVTMADGKTARFPDAVTTRGRRHMETLQQLCDAGSRAVVLFVVQRVDCDEVAPADAIDPAYGEALRKACENGVEAVAVQARVTAKGIHLEQELPVVLA